MERNVSPTTKGRRLLYFVYNRKTKREFDHVKERDQTGAFRMGILRIRLKTCTYACFDAKEHQNASKRCFDALHMHMYTFLHVLS